MGRKNLVDSAAVGLGLQPPFCAWLNDRCSHRAGWTSRAAVVLKLLWGLSRGLSRVGAGGCSFGGNGLGFEPESNGAISEQLT